MSNRRKLKRPMGYKDRGGGHHHWVKGVVSDWPRCDEPGCGKPLKLVIGPDEEEWELIDQAEDSPPASFLRQCLEEEGIPYQMVKVPHPDVVGDGIECDLGSRAENEAFIRRARERWGKEEWDGRHS